MPDRCGPPREAMHSGELTARLHEIGDSIYNRANTIEKLAADRDDEMLLIGVKALRDDGLLLHALAEAMDELVDVDPTFLAVLMQPVDRKYEERRRP